MWPSAGKSLYYISTKPFSTTYKHYFKIISQGNGKLVAYSLRLKCYVHNKLTWLRRVKVGIRSLVCIINLPIAPVGNFWWGWAVRAKELRILVSSDFFQTWKLSSWKPYLCLTTHSYTVQLVLRKIQHFTT